MEGSRAQPAPTLPSPVPPGPMECPSALQQPQRPNRLGAPEVAERDVQQPQRALASHPGWRAELGTAPPGLIG